MGARVIASDNEYRYATKPTVTAGDPTSVNTSASVWVTIHGTNFDGASAVSFDGPNAEIAPVSRAMINAVGPAGNGEVHVVVTTPGGTSDRRPKRRSRVRRPCNLAAQVRGTGRRYRRAGRNGC